ncbi:MAG: (Fe-S)-binding protein [Deltaproteobacteria bacterium]|nr:(Fe-S)-binding protein [Deltaproteobacteria bacterium]
MLTAISMSVLLVAGLAVFAALVIPRTRLLFAMKKEARCDQLGARVLGTLKFAFGQWRMPREPIAGFAHIFIFVGFLVVSIATITHFAHAYDHAWIFPGLSGTAGRCYSWLKDVFQGLVLAGVLYGLWRRLKPTPSRVGRSWEGIFVLCMILTLMVTDFLISGAELVDQGVTTMPWYLPGGWLGSRVLAPLGPQAAHFVGVVSWWVHCVCILVFLNFLPLGKHFHVITAIPNVFFRNLKPWGFVEKTDLENSEKFGIRGTADLTWSMLLNTYACTECGRCTVYCPTVLTGKPLAHRQLNLDLKHAVYADKATLLAKDAKKIEELPVLVGERIKPETIWACTTCGSCELECPVLIENVPRIIQMRQYKTLMEGDVAPELARAFKGMENNNNPWGIGADQRDKWAEGLDIPRMADVAASGKEAPLLYWVGCAGSFDDRNKKITLAVVKILKAAGVDFAILGAEEGCTGDSARRAGNEYLFQAMATANVELLNKYKVKKILTHCPHCLHTLKVDYPQFGGNYEVVHHSELIDSLVASGKLRLAKPQAGKVAWHDSCYLGRYHDIYAAPRSLVRAAGGTVVELPRHHSRSVCCGAGGARFWMEENIGERINVHRSKEALAAGTPTVGSACPFCLTMLKDGVAALNNETVKTLDVAEIVAQAL